MPPRAPNVSVFAPDHTPTPPTPMPAASAPNPIVGPRQHSPDLQSTAAQVRCPMLALVSSRHLYHGEHTVSTRFALCGCTPTCLWNLRSTHLQNPHGVPQTTLAAPTRTSISPTPMPSASGTKPARGLYQHSSKHGPANVVYKIKRCLQEWENTLSFVGRDPSLTSQTTNGSRWDSDTVPQ